MMDIVFPEKNEQEFFEMAKKLGLKELLPVYPSVQPVPKAPAGLKVKTAVLSEPSKARQLRNKGLVVFVHSSDNDRMVLEQGGADVLFGTESTMPKDYMHQRGSGLNHVMCELAKKNNVAVGFSFAKVLETSGSQRAQILGRMMQNIMLCRKYKVKMIIGSFAKNPWQMRSMHDLQAFFVTIGMRPEETRKGL
jgi:ribonuclease P/MRP protein subunit RPP1